MNRNEGVGIGEPENYINQRQRIGYCTPVLTGIFFKNNLSARKMIVVYRDELVRIVDAVDDPPKIIFTRKVGAVFSSKYVLSGAMKYPKTATIIATKMTIRPAIAGLFFSNRFFDRVRGEFDLSERFIQFIRLWASIPVLLAR